MRKPNTRYFVLTILLCAAIAFLLVTLRGGPSRERSSAARTLAGPAAVRAEAMYLPPAAPGDVGYDRYQVVVDRNVFARSAPAQARPVSPPPKGSLPPLNPSRPKPKPEPDEPAGPPAAARLDGWSYLGYVEIDGTLMGLLRNDGDQSSQFVKAGDEFRGLTVTEVTLDEIRLESGRRQTTLARIESYPLVPLDKAAARTSTAAASRTSRRPIAPQER